MRSESMSLSCSRTTGHDLLQQQGAAAAPEWRPMRASQRRRRRRLRAEQFYFQRGLGQCTAIDDNEGLVAPPARGMDWRANNSLPVPFSPVNTTGAALPAAQLLVRDDPP